MQGVVSIGRIQGRRTGIQLVRLEAISGAMSAFPGPKDAGGLVGCPKDPPKG